MKKNYFLLLIGFLLISSTAIAQQGTSLNFDGVDDEVVCGNDASVQITGTAITMEARIKADVYDPLGFYADNIINKINQPGNVLGYGMRIGGNRQANVIFGGDIAAWTELTTPNDALPVAGTWFHLAATYDGSMIRIYVDGTEVASTAATISIGNSTAPLRLGESSFSGRYMDGNLDEVRIWNVVRTPAEIDANKNSALTLPQTGLMAYYKFNQGVGGADNSTETVVIDEMGNNNGTLANFALNGTSSNWVADSTLSTTDFSLDSISVFPNPVNDVINVKGLSESTQYIIYNMLGQEVSKGSVFEKGINTDELLQGIYIMKLGEIGSLRFVKK